MATSLDSEAIASLKTRVTLVGAGLNIFLTIIKIGVGIIGQSAALIADGVHSLSDLASDLIVLLAIKLGAGEADFEHPYGHKRFETVATVILGLSLIAIALGIAWDISERLLQPETLLIPDRDALGIAMISILVNEWLYHYTKRISVQTNSKLLLANAWHHRSDAISSIIVLFGIGAVLLGYPFADAIAAILVALMVAKIGYKLVAESLKELVDASVPESLVQEIRREIKLTDGVASIHLLRTRQMSEDAYIDTHIVVDPRISVSEGHIIGDTVRKNLMHKFDTIVDVLVHIDPEDDEFNHHSHTPISRSQILQILQKKLGNELYKQLDIVTIHYLNERVECEVVVSRLLVVTAPEKISLLQQSCQDLIAESNNIDDIYLLLKA